MKKFIGIALCGMFLFTSAAFAGTGNLQLYVRNRPYKGVAAVASGKMHVATDEILKALNMNWTVNGNVIEILSAGNSTPPIPAGTYSFHAKGKDLHVKTYPKNGKAFVNLAQLASEMGWAYETSTALGSVDVAVPVGVIAKQNPAKAGDSKDNKAGSGKQITTDGTNPESPIVINDMDCADAQNLAVGMVGEVRPNCSFSNGGNQTLKNVSAVLTLEDLTGYTLTSWTKVIGDMEPYASVEFDPDPPVWFNYNNINVVPKIKITHDALEKEEDEEGGEGAK